MASDTNKVDRKMKLEKLVRRWKAPTLLQLLREHPSLTKILICTCAIFFKYRIVNKKMIIKYSDVQRSYSIFVRDLIS